MYGDNPAPPPKKAMNLTIRKVGVLLCELSEDEDEDKISEVGDLSGSQDAPWHSDLNLRDQLRRMSIVKWWGVCIKNNLPTLADF